MQAKDLKTFHTYLPNGLVIKIRNYCNIKEIKIYEFLIQIIENFFKKK